MNWVQAVTTLSSLMKCLDSTKNKKAILWSFKSPNFIIWIFFIIVLCWTNRLSNLYFFIIHQELPTMFIKEILDPDVYYTRADLIWKVELEGFPFNVCKGLDLTLKIKVKCSCLFSFCVSFSSHFWNCHYSDINGTIFYLKVLYSGVRITFPVYKKSVSVLFYFSGPLFTCFWEYIRFLLFLKDSSYQWCLL